MGPTEASSFDSSIARDLMQVAMHRPTLFVGQSSRRQVRKVVNLEDVAAEFRLRASAVIDRIQQLEKLDRLSGIFDDRGKYIYITAEDRRCSGGLPHWRLRS